MHRTLVSGLAVVFLASGFSLAEEYFGAELEATPGSSSVARAMASMSLDVGESALTYRIRVDGVDLDGLQTPDPDDDVTSVRLVHMSEGPVVFGLIGPDDDPGGDPVIDPVGGVLTGIWDDGDDRGLSAQLTNLRADELYLAISTVGSDSDLSWAGIGGYIQDVRSLHFPMEPGTDPLSGDLFGELFFDGSGYWSHNGTLVDYPLDGSEWVAGMLGRALEFDGVDQHVSHTVELTRPQGTIAHWLRPESLGLRVAVYESDAPAAGETYNGFGLVSDSLEIHTGIFNSEFFAMFQDGSGSLNTPGSGHRRVQGGSVTVGEWSHVAMTWNLLGELRLYVDCEEVASENMADGVFAGRATSDRFIGRPSETSGRHWDGQMDEVKILGVEMTADQVQTTFCPAVAAEHPPFFGVTPQPDFGIASAMDGEWLAVGTEDGGVDIFRRDGVLSWTFAHHKAVDPWGWQSITLEGPTLVIGSTQSQVEVYSKNHGGADAWGHVTTLLPKEGDSGDFGRAVDLFEDMLVVGSPGTDSSAYAYSRHEGGVDAWGEIPLTSLGGSYSFGVLTQNDQWVFLAGNPPAVGVFRWQAGTWGFVDIINGPWTDENDGLDGIWALAVRGDMLLVGLGGEGPGGAVNVYRYDGDGNGWTFDHRFGPSDSDWLDLFGSDLVWLEDDLVAVAAGVGTSSDHSAVYTFRLDEGGIWRQETAYLPQYYQSLDEQSVGFSSMTGDGDVVLVGTNRSFDGDGSMRVFFLGLFYDGFESEDLSAWSSAIQ